MGRVLERSDLDRMLERSGGYDVVEK